MKLLLLIAAVVFANVANSQIIKDHFTQKEADASFKSYRSTNQFSLRLHDSTIVLTDNFLAGKKKPGVYSLRQDGMPCIVPDTKNVAAIPNAWKGPVKIPYTPAPPKIPNP